MPELFAKRWNVKATIAIVVLALLVLYGIAYIAIPLLNPQHNNAIWNALSALVREFASSLLATSFLGGVIVLLTPSVMEIAKLSPIEPREIRGLLDTAAYHSTLWCFRGGLGRDFRTKTLPALDRQARSKSSTKSLLVLIIDPTNTSACEAYSTYRNSISGKEDWSGDTIADELCATILTIADYSTHNSLLDVRIGLVGNWSTFRIDLTSPYAIITRADVNDAAVRCDAGSSFYNAYQTEIQIAYQQSRKLSIAHDIPIVRTVDAAKELLSRLEIGRGFSDDRLSAIVSRSNVQGSPYGR